MRSLLPLAIAASTAAWSIQPHAVAGEPGDPERRLASEHPHLHHDHDHDHDRAHDRNPGSGRSWKWLLRSGTLRKNDYTTLQRVAPYLEVSTYDALDVRQRADLLRYARNRLGPKTPLARCWAPGTPAPILLAYHAVEEAARAEAELRKANQFLRRWSRTATDGNGQNLQGRPVTLTWSIVPDGTPIPSDPAIGDSSDPSDLRARLAEIYGGTTGPPENQPWFPIIREVFDNIAAKTGINYTYERMDDGRQLSEINEGQRNVRGDIRLGGHAIDGPSFTLAYTYFPDHGDTVIDTDDSWFEDLRDNSIRLANTIEHEHGHALGMEHVCPVNQTKLMEPFIPSAFRGIQFDEIYTLQRWYGDPLEHHRPFRDNDSFVRATQLRVTPDAPWSSEWLSIDDNSDVDHFALNLPRGVELTVRVLPSTGQYLEGAQHANGTCATGTVFDPGSHHDLTLELLGPGSNNVIASAISNPAGEPEEIVDFQIPTEGRHLIRVNGGDANLAQLYRLEIEIGRPPTVFALRDQSIVTESFAPANQSIEPGETVELEISLVNNGRLPAADVQATLSGPPGFTAFDASRNYGNLDPATPVARSFVFALSGDCGSTLPLQLELTGAGGLQQSLPVLLSLGTLHSELAETFDTSGGIDLPAGWSMDASGEGSGWDFATARTDSPPFSLFADDVASGAGLSTLTSPSLTLTDTGGTLRFRHFFDLEASRAIPDRGYDGGVLEISAGGGPWQDILDAGASFRQGGYTRTLHPDFDNPLAGRRAWSGRSDRWLTSVVELPPGLGGQPLRFRWRLGHDRDTAAEGWYLDNIEVTTARCADTSPAVAITVEDDTASEFSPLTQGRLTFSTTLPPLADLAITLLNAGTASMSEDVSGLDGISLPAGQTSVEIHVLAVHDDEVEGAETLVLSLDPASGLVPAGPPTATITVLDAPYGQWAAASLGLGEDNGPLQDRDRDGSLNIEEYGWHTDGASPLDRPRPGPRLDGGYLRIDAPLASLPGDLFLRGETSTDLQNWNSTGVETLADGFRVLAGDSTRYLRLVYGLIPAAP